MLDIYALAAVPLLLAIVLGSSRSTDAVTQSDTLAAATFAGGCFWCIEPPFDKLDGVVSTTSGYTGGHKKKPTYEEVSAGSTGHTEAVLVAFEPAVLPLEQVLRLFWENHDPTQGMRQGNDLGTQYRSVIHAYGEDQRRAAEASRDAYQRALSEAGYGEITTEITDAPEFYFAEDYHQQYLAKNPNGYCPDHSTGVACPVGLALPAGTPEAPMA